MFIEDLFLELDNSTFVEIISFCFINELLEKVEVEKVVNLEDFLKGEKPITENYIYSFPNIPTILKSVISFQNYDTKENQCNSNSDLK